jgi:hypothetical protein
MKKFFIIFILALMMLVYGLNGFAIHEEIPAETQETEGMPTTFTGRTSVQLQNPYLVQALIKILKKKKIITQKELDSEIELLKNKDIRRR